MRSKLGSIFMGLVFLIFPKSCLPQTLKKDIYRGDWIDHNKNGVMDPYENPKLHICKRVEDLLSRMTLEEKTCQLATLYGFRKVLKDKQPNEKWKQSIWKDGIANIDEHLNGWPRSEYDWPPSKHAKAMNNVQRFFIEETRLGIPVDFTNEGIHGLKAYGATCFPAQIGLGATWDKELISKVGWVTAREAKALGYTCVYAPILDLARDPRWGRSVETYGEDPFHASMLGLSMVKALQKGGVSSSPKHYCVYSIPEGGRDGRARTAPHATPREVFEILIAPFRTAIKYGHARGVMSSYNDYDGIPITGSKFFLIKKLRQEWGFKGYVVSDSGAVEYIHSKHHIASDFKEAVKIAVESGLNVWTNFRPPSVYINPLRELVREGSLPIEIINERVRDVLRVKFALGLFDKPYVENPEKSDEIVHCKTHKDLSLRASRECLVLLKNEKAFLPLKKENIKTILVTGPIADEKKRTVPGYGPVGAQMVSVLEGIKQKAGDDIQILYTKGCNVVDKRWPQSEILYEPPKGKDLDMINEAKKLAEKADVAIVVLGETTRIVGESRSRTSLDLPGFQRDLLKAIHSTGTPILAVLMNGRALSINWLKKNAKAIIEAWFPGEMGGIAIAEAIFGEYNPGGKLPVTFPKTVGQIPMCFPYKPASHAKGRTRVSGVLYPFGHGLSYTIFKYSNLEITPKEQKPGGWIKVSFDIENTGNLKGDEVPQLYIRDLVSSVITPVKVLRGFTRITLSPGEKKKIHFILTPRHLAILNRHMEWTVEPGEFEVQIGSSSTDIRLKGRFKIID